MDISSEENQGKIDIIKNKLDKNLLTNDQIKDYYKNGELVIVRDDVNISSDDIFKEVKKKYLNNTGKIVHTMLHDGLIRVHIPNKKYDLYWSYKDCIPVKLLEEIPSPSYEPKETERILESVKGKFRKIAILINSGHDSEIVQKILFNNGYKWSTPNSRITVHLFNNYPIVLFAYIDDMSIMVMEMELDQQYYIDNLRDLKNGVYRQTYYKLFNINSLSEYIKLIKFKKETPTYKPRKINRTLEMNNLKKYNDFLFDSILEDIENGELPLVLSSRLRDTLKKIDHPISDKLLDVDIDNDQSFSVTLVDMTDENDKFSVGSSNKLTDLLSDHINDFDSEDFTYFTTDPESTYIWDKFRSVVKIGRLIKKIFPDEFADNGSPGEDIESFINLYKTNFTEDNTKDLFEVVKGKDIIEWYRLSNYATGKSGSILRNSCMAEGCDDYINFYAINPKKVSMLILYEDDMKEKIVGRALLWNIDEINGEEVKRVFMDRIYTLHEYQVNYFIKYAEEHDYLYKESQAADEEKFIDPIGEDGYLDLTVYGINPSRYYPYLDTIQYYFHDKKILTNNNSSDHDHESLYLQDTGGDVFNGRYSEKYKRWIALEDENYVMCELLTFDLTNSERIRKKEDAVYLPFYQEWIPKERYENNVIQIDIDGDYEMLKRDAVYLKFYGGWAPKNTLYKYVKSKYYDDYLLDEDCVYSNKLNDNLIKDKSIKVYKDITKTEFDYLPDNSDELKEFTYTNKGDYILKK